MKEKILFFDIETTPLLGYTWGKWQQDVLSFKKERYLLCFAYKWLGGSATQVMSLRTHPGRTKSDDRRLCRELWKLMDSADIIVAHNGAKFDVKVANAFFLRHRFSPPSPAKVVDTLTVAKRHFYFTSNSLNDLAKHLGIGQKIKHSGINLWLECMAGDEDAWHRMELYNKRDVDLLEKVYLRLRPYMDRHPNMNLFLGRVAVCPNCGGKRLQARGYYMTRVTRAQRYQCITCGAWCHGKPQQLGVEMR